MNDLIQKQQERFDEQFSYLHEFGDYGIKDEIKSLMLQNAREIYEDLEKEVEQIADTYPPLESDDFDRGIQNTKAYVLQIIKTKKDESIS